MSEMTRRFIAQT